MSRSSEKGSAVVTTLILLPILIAFAELIVLGGRFAGAQADLNAAAREAARQVSVSAGPASGAVVIYPVASVPLTNSQYSCTVPYAEYGPNTSFVPGGIIEVKAECTVNFSDLSFLGIGYGQKRLTVTVAEPIDTYRVVE